MFKIIYKNMQLFEFKPFFFFRNNLILILIINTITNNISLQACKETSYLIPPFEITYPWTDLNFICRKVA